MIEIKKAPDLFGHPAATSRKRKYMQNNSFLDEI